MHRLALAAIISILISAPQAFALSPLEEQTRLASAPEQATSTTAPRVAVPRSRTDRWRGAPYTRTENETLRREALDKRLVRSGEMPVGTSFSNEDDHLLRREALDKRFPMPDFGSSPAPGLGF